MSAAFLFAIQPASGVPIYRQLMDQVLLLAASGRLKAGELLPSVRQVAEEVQVNPMTVSKAWSLLEREGVVELVRGQGMRLLAPSARGGLRARQDELKPIISQLAARARQLSLPADAVLEQVRRALEELDHGR